MPQPALKRELAVEAVERVEAKLREGFRPRGINGPGAGAVSAASEAAVTEGWCASVSSFETRLRIAKTSHGMEPDWSLYRPQRYQQPVPLAVTHPAAPVTAQALPTGPGERVLAIGDLHQDPRHPDRLEILTWIARYASEHRFDRIVQIGDWSTWDSVNQHDKNDTHAAKFKPQISDDMANLETSLRAFRLGIDPDYKPRCYVTLGNHENRLERFENATPEAHGTFTRQRDELFLGFGWKPRPYGELFYIEGVAFTHHPVNGAGRAFGGETGPQRAANKTTVPVVSGHTHRRQIHDAAKIGPVERISMVEIGCALPWGTIEGYARHSNTGWWWGVCDLTVNAGEITDCGFVSMLTLEARYGRKLAA
jgi:hypothetical protein